MVKKNGLTLNYNKTHDNSYNSCTAVIKQSSRIQVFWVVLLNSRVFYSQNLEAMHDFTFKGHRG